MRVNLRDQSNKQIMNTFEMDNKVNQAVNFLSEIQMGVKSDPRTAQKVISVLSKTATVLNSWLVLTMTVAAQTVKVSSDLIITGQTVYATVFLIGIVTALVALTIAAISKMLLKKSFGETWRTDILHGLKDMLIAPLIVTLVVGAVYYLAPSIPIFQPLQEPLRAVFGNVLK